MTDQSAPKQSKISTANVKQKSRGISPVWVIPIVAALVGGWMVFQSVLEENAQVEVTFKSAAGIEAGKTLVKVRDIVVGKVINVEFTDNLGVVRVVIEFDGIGPEHVTDVTRFWVVRPRIGAGGVSGLDTLLSGAYIEADPGEGGSPATKFQGLEEPGNYQLGNPGTTYKLESATLGSLSRGSPIKYRGITVGQVTRFKMTADGSLVDIEIFVRAPFDKLVKNDTRFWNISGLTIDAGADGLQVNVDSLTTLMVGGISFSATDAPNDPQAKAGSMFNLYQNESDELEAEAVAFHVPMKMHFTDGVKGLEAGAPVEYKGLRLGTVSKVFFVANETLGTNSVKQDLDPIVQIRIEPDRLPGIENYRHDTREKRIQSVYDFFGSLANRGVRAQLETGNLITGKTLITFKSFPEVDDEPLKFVDGMAVFPTMPESLAGILQKVDGILNKVNKILAKVDAIPITEIGQNLEGATAKINQIPMEEIGNNMADLTARLDAIPTGEISNDIQETLESLQALIESLNAAKGGVVGVQTRRALAEITRAATALRGMAEYLERHPEALLKGKQ